MDGEKQSAADAWHACWLRLAAAARRDTQNLEQALAELPQRLASEVVAGQPSPRAKIELEVIRQLMVAVQLQLAQAQREAARARAQAYERADEGHQALGPDEARRREIEMAVSRADEARTAIAALISASSHGLSAAIARPLVGAQAALLAFQRLSDDVHQQRDEPVAGLGFDGFASDVLAAMADESSEVAAAGRASIMAAAVREDIDVQLESLRAL